MHHRASPFRWILPFALLATAVLWWALRNASTDAPTALPSGMPPSQPGAPSEMPKPYRDLLTTSPPEAAETDGAPVRRGGRVLFRVQVPPEVEQVFLAGDFNGWGQNTGGAVTHSRFAMRPLGNGRFWLEVDLHRARLAYQYVLRYPDNRHEWIPDPNVEATDGEGHSLVHLPPPVPDAEQAPVPVDAPAMERLDPVPRRVWAPPGTERAVRVEIPDVGKNAVLRFRVSDPFGDVLASGEFPAQPGPSEFPLPAIDREGGFRVDVDLVDSGEAAASGWTVVSSVTNVADDLRYGFFATYPAPEGEYGRKADLLARYFINAVEYYDYFPAHGVYAPTREHYSFEPFDVEIHAEDLRRKIEAGHRRNILSLAYVAAYAASESVYRTIPDPMTDREGRVKVFTGQVTTEEDAEREGKEAWFWIMNVSAGSDWYRYILEEFRRALDDTPNDLVSFDGFEVDTYGDPADTRFYTRGGSPRDGDLLSEVLRDFMSGVRALTREIKPHGLVSFNSVNEFGVEEMYDVTDFLFMEIWRFYTDRLAELVDIVEHHGAARNQRVVLKLYPADMDPKHASWPALTLARVLGACMTGGGSLMVAGEPDEASGQMHGLNSLYYPDHAPLRPESARLLKRYHRHDALLYGLTHGRGVFNAPLRVDLPGCVVRAALAPERDTLSLRMLHLGGDPSWSSAIPFQSALAEVPVSVTLPGSMDVRDVWYVTPDHPGYHRPRNIAFTLTGNRLGFRVPHLHVHGTVLVRFHPPSPGLGEVVRRAE